MSFSFDKDLQDLPHDRNYRNRFIMRLVTNFDSYYLKEQDCNQALLSALAEDGKIVCRVCSSTDIKYLYGERSGICNSCNAKVRLTASTFFKGIRRVRPWLFAIKLLEHGITVNACELHRAVGISVSAAAQILKKVALVVFDYLQDEAAVVEEASSGFLPLFSRRSLETPMNEHPSAEEFATQKKYLTTIAVEQEPTDPADIVTSPSTGVVSISDKADSLNQDESAVLSLLSSTPIDIETLMERSQMRIGKLSATITTMELKGLIDSVGGNRYAIPRAQALFSDVGKFSSFLAYPNTSPSSIPAVTSAMNSIRSCFHGISRKYLQLYLGIHSCSFDRARWSAGSLLKACSRFRKISQEHIRTFVTPIVVKLIAGPAAQAVS